MRRKREAEARVGRWGTGSDRQGRGYRGTSPEGSDGWRRRSFLLPFCWSDTAYRGPNGGSPSDPWIFTRLPDTREHFCTQQNLQLLQNQRSTDRSLEKPCRAELAALSRRKATFSSWLIFT